MRWITGALILTACTSAGFFLGSWLRSEEEHRLRQQISDHEAEKKDSMYWKGWAEWHKKERNELQERLEFMQKRENNKFPLRWMGRDKPREI